MTPKTIELKIAIDESKMAELGRRLGGGFNDALIELIREQPMFGEPGVALTSAAVLEGGRLDLLESPSARTLGQDQQQIRDGDNREEHGDLDVFETGIYAYRWPNGDCSVLCANSRRDAIFALDEWAEAHPSNLHALDNFMVDFKLGDEGELLLANIGEQASADLWEKCYPDLDEELGKILAAANDLEDDLSPQVRQRVLQAVERERNRLRENQPRDEASTELGKGVARALGASGIVADQYVKLRAKQLLDSLPEKKDKLN